MPVDFSALDRLWPQLEDSVREGLREMAEKVEIVVKAEMPYTMIDTGALHASITGYCVDWSDPRKNINDPEWQIAQREGNKHGRHKFIYNPPDNYKFYSVEKDVGEKDAYVAVVTSFVEYAGDSNVWTVPPGNVTAPNVEEMFGIGLTYMGQILEQEVGDSLRLVLA